jgi:hypothetical protein
MFDELEYIELEDELEFETLELSDLEDLELELG